MVESLEGSKTMLRRLKKVEKGGLVVKGRERKVREEWFCRRLL